MTAPPGLSIVIPAYNSHATLGGCLKAIGTQTFRSFEVIVVDSGPSDEGERIIRRDYPWVRLERASGRLLPHAARNRGVELATADVIVFTDPDIYPQGDWLARLVGAHERRGGIVVGSVACYGQRWIDLGIHLAKFDQWLTGSPPGAAAIAPTLNLLCPRVIFDELGGFPGEYMIGDTLFSWSATTHGYGISFAPEAVVYHHHVSSWGQLLQERFNRGSEFGLIRLQRGRWGRGRRLLHLLLSIVPIRLTRLTARTLRHASRAGMLGVALSTSPIILTGHAAWLLGESRAYLWALAPND